MHRWVKPWGKSPTRRSRIRLFHRWSRWRSLAVVTGLIATLLVIPLPTSDVDSATANTLPSCRSTGLTTTSGNVTIDLNGHYVANNIKVEPIYSKRMYADFSAGYDAMYIGYRIENTSTSTISNLWLSLSNFSADIVPTQPRLNDVEIGTLARGDVVTKFFYVKATDYTTTTQSHTVTVSNGLPGATGSTTRAECRADIDGVYRSIAAKANKVTAITASASGYPASLGLGDTLTIRVEGAPGKVGAGATPDNAVMTLSPANYASWPAGALRLTEVDIQFNGVQNVNSCTPLLGGRSTGSSSSQKWVTFRNELVIPSVNRCASTTKQTYVIEYQFTVANDYSSNPQIRPVSDIASGTQVKYTGAYPSVLPDVDFSGLTVPSSYENISVTKALASQTIEGSRLVATYEVRAELSGTSPPDVVLDNIVDTPSEGVVFSSAGFTDKTRTTSTTITPLLRGTSARPELQFVGPFTVGDGAPLVLTYSVTYPLPADGVTTVYGNQAFGLIGSFVLASNGATVGVQGIDLSVTNNGGNYQVSSQPTLITGTPQEIDFSLPSHTGVGASTTLMGYSDSGLPLSYASTTPTICTVTEFDGEWTVIALDTGTCAITATQAGDSSFAAATAVTASMTVLAGQIITHDPVPVLTGAGTSGSLTVNSSSGLDVTLTLLTPDECSIGATNPVTVSSGQAITVTAILGGGECMVLATQAGSSTIGPAPDVVIIIGIGNPQHIQVTGVQLVTGLSDATNGGATTSSNQTRAYSPSPPLSSRKQFLVRLQSRPILPKQARQIFPFLSSR